MAASVVAMRAVYRALYQPLQKQGAERMLSSDDESAVAPGEPSLADVESDEPMADAEASTSIEPPIVLNAEADSADAVDAADPRQVEVILSL